MKINGKTSFRVLGKFLQGLVEEGGKQCQRWPGGEECSSRTRLAARWDGLAAHLSNVCMGRVGGRAGRRPRPIYNHIAGAGWLRLVAWTHPAGLPRRGLSRREVEDSLEEQLLLGSRRVRKADGGECTLGEMARSQRRHSVRFRIWSNVVCESVA